MDDGQVSPSEYAEDKIRYMAEDVVHDTSHAVKKETDKVVEKGRKALREHREEKRLERREKKVEDAVRQYEQSAGETANNTVRETHRTVRAKDRSIRTAQQTEHTVKQTARSTGKATIKTADASVKTTAKGIKTAEKTSKAAIKTAEATAKASKKAAEAAAKAAQKAAEAARQAAIAAYKTAVAVGKAIVAAVKAIIAAIKELVAAIAAGGWVAVVVIIVICLIALIVGSAFGIFFSSESNGKSNMTMQQVVRDINEDYQDKIETIKASINQRRKIRFQKVEYNVKKDRVLHHGGETYTFSPYSLVWDGDFYYVVGYSDKYQSIGSHRVDRIYQRPEILDEAAVPAPLGFDVNKYINTTFRMYNAPRREVELVCDNGVMDAIIDRFGPDVETYACDQQNFRVIAEVAVGTVFFNWIFGFNGKVKIKAPEDVKEQYKDQVFKAAELLK